MRLFIIQDNGFGYGGGWSYLVCAKSHLEAQKVVQNIPEDVRKLPFYKYTSYDIYTENDLGELQEGDFRLLSYYE